MPQQPDDVLQLARKFRAQLLAREAQATGEMIASYRGIVARLQPQLDTLTVRLAADAADGKIPSPLSAARREDVKAMLADARRELDAFSKATATQTAARQSTLVGVAGNHAKELARAAARNPSMSWAKLQPSQIEDLTGLLRPGTPAHELLEKLAPTGVERVREALVSGLSVGRTPEKIGKDVQDVLGGNMGRFLTVARTEDTRAYRLATTENFRANADVVSGWRWHASLSYSTCAACLSLHGQVFPIGTEQDGHPSCRCTQIPITKGEADPSWQTGEQWLRAQPADIQARALSPAKLDAWKRGEISLSDLRGHTSDKAWGGGYHETGLEKAKAKARR